LKFNILHSPSIMSGNQPGSCCVKGELHAGTPVGREDRLYGLDCYISDPPGGEPPKGVVVILSDVFGWKLPNTRILADEYAKRGRFQVMIPDFFDGNTGLRVSPFVSCRRELMVIAGKGLPTSLIVSLNALEQDTGIVALIKSVWHWAWMVRDTSPTASQSLKRELVMVRSPLDAKGQSSDCPTQDLFLLPLLERRRRRQFTRRRGRILLGR
jgi:hypothetical protein